MIQAVVLEDTKFLIPNKQHKNFTCSDEVVRKGSNVKGEFKQVSGLRRGEPFVYRLFGTEGGKFLYADKVQNPMAVTEVSLGVDGNVSAQKSIVSSPKSKALLVMLGGAIAGFAYGKYKKAGKADLVKYSAVGAVGAYGIYFLIEKSKSTEIQKIK